MKYGAVRMAFTCVSASVLDADGCDGFHRINALKRVRAINVMDVIYVHLPTVCSQNFGQLLTPKRFPPERSLGF